MRKLVLVLMSALLALSALALVGCGKNDEAVIREGLTAELDEFKDANSASYALLVSEMSALGDIGIDSSAFIASWLDGFAYSVGDIKIDGDAATATVDITVKQLGPAMEAAMEQVTAMQDNPSWASKSEAEVMAAIGSYFTEALAAEPLATTTITLDYVMADNAWQPGPNFESSVVQAFAGESSLF
ncbi:MAG: hypothetical protein LBU48_04435 [Coriobacteriales bacterium]|jgi:hypothetical protein|nr:hypothetical protein [Coriobacteriales bacterium]